MGCFKIKLTLNIIETKKTCLKIKNTLIFKILEKMLTLENSKDFKF